ncbi:protein cornichon homolog 5 isoform X1 [Arabidopsis lyrata subsp. lyrata]|uniref:protein cornichon homolog 5 isoform X1 n=1 Tax=Arabidopsis lyrata subsp. lyrata TaxID=81972 RepID=UPI000A29BBB1|nr:protein cornichon homolog 5 isoform X1 [Arabidopsis lyrata subsp. lyrata]|eukprot:XP_020877743.1 protein cornichon homolog 5 isoform X1 [Arabidopsis lyrata subsp. lyrata]
MGDLLDWIISFLFLVTLLIIVIYQLTCLADLEFDRRNPYDASTKINRMVLPEFGLQGLLCLYYVLTGHWFMAVLSLPHLFYNIRLYMKREHLADVTELYNTNKWEQKKRVYKIGHIALSIFITSYWYISFSYATTKY